MENYEKPRRKLKRKKIKQLYLKKCCSSGNITLAEWFEVGIPVRKAFVFLQHYYVVKCLTATHSCKN